ncbi:hypothetical protein [Streptomyces sp. NPDC004788]
MTEAEADADDEAEADEDGAAVADTDAEGDAEEDGDADPLAESPGVAVEPVAPSATCSAAGASPPSLPQPDTRSSAPPAAVTARSLRARGRRV